MNGWRQTTLGDLITLQRGYDLPEYERLPGDVPVYGSFGITGYHNKARAGGPGVTLGRSGASFGVVNFSPTAYWPHNTVLFVTDFKGNDPRFVSYLLKTINFSAFNSGSAQPSLNRNFLYPHPVVVPERSTQERIASILSAYDDLIENNTRRIKILEEMAQRLYREWFVNFRFPGHEKVPMVDSEMGPIPKGWTAHTLGGVLQLEYGKALKAEDRMVGSVAVYGSSGVVGYHNEKLADGPGIVVGRKGNVGSVFLSQSDFWVIDTAYYVRTTLPLHFVYYNLHTQNFLNNDAAVPGLNRNQAYSLPVLLPEAQILRKFARIVEPMFNLKFCLERRNANLRTTRDLLLPKLISGEVSVDNIDAETGAEVEALA